jgi:2-hydroxychromene-2-carboxylate isomerase
MKTITFWFDPISPFAYLAFERLPQVLEGCSYLVQHRPVLFAGLLAHHGSKGPAEIEPKRAWTFRHVHWLAHAAGVPMQTPQRHPFNPLPLLRLALAAGDVDSPVGGDGVGGAGPGTCNRRVAEAVLHHVWRGQGADALDAKRLQQLHDALQPARDPQGDAVKAELRSNGEAALAQGVFGVPSFELEGRLFWGLDSLPMLRAALLGEAWFDGPAWAAEGAPREGIRRA